MSQLSKATLIPLGFVIFLLGFTYQIGSSYAELKNKIEYLEKTDDNQADAIRQLSEQVIQLNENIIRQSEIMKNLESKIK